MANNVGKFSNGSENLMVKRTVIAILASLLIGLLLALFNGLDLISAVKAALIFSVITGAIVAMLSWAVEIAREKGYSAVIAFLAVIILNIFGILLLLALPSTRKE